jgi:hypothetical protein
MARNRRRYAAAAVLNKIRSIDEHAMHDHRESARQRHFGLAYAGA